MWAPEDALAVTALPRVHLRAGPHTHTHGQSMDMTVGHVFPLWTNGGGLVAASETPLQ